MKNEIASSPDHPIPPAGGRDLRLDFVRGLALLIIFVNHIPDNEGQFFTLSRYGWSDAAEVFVFCSGYVSALVFGKSFERSGLGSGTVRVLQRCMQIYAAHLGLFAALALSCLWGNALNPGHDYIQKLNIGFLFEQTQVALPAMVTLTYLPNGIDILPMYLMLLAWTPLFWVLSRVSKSLAVLVSVALYAATYLVNMDLSAQPGTDRAWFFNPFAWQLMFFGGYVIGAGWIKIRLGIQRRLLACLAIVLLAVPFAHEQNLRPLDWMMSLYGWIDPVYEKTRLGPLRILHFAALAYLVATLLERHGAWLRRPAAECIRVLGRNSLAIFSLGLLLARLCGMVLDQTGHGLLPLLGVNLGGLALLIGVGQVLAWVDDKPWKQVRLPVAASDPRGTHWTFDLAEFQRVVLRPVAMAALLMPLAVAPFLLPKKPIPQPDPAAAMVEIDTGGLDDAALTPFNGLRQDDLLPADFLLPPEDDR